MLSTCNVTHPDGAGLLHFQEQFVNMEMCDMQWTIASSFNGKLIKLPPACIKNVPRLLTCLFFPLFRHKNQYICLFDCFSLRSMFLNDGAMIY